MKMPSLTNNLYKYQTSAGILIDRLGGTDDEYEFSDTEEHNNNIYYGSEVSDDDGEMIDLQATDNETETVVASNHDNDSSDDDDSDDETFKEIFNRYKELKKKEEEEDEDSEDSMDEEEEEALLNLIPFKKKHNNNNDEDDEEDDNNNNVNADEDADEEEEDRKMSPNTHKAWLAAEAEAQFLSPPAFLEEIKQEVDKENNNDHEDALDVARQLDFNDGLLVSPVARKPMNLRWSNKKKATKKSSKAKKKFADVPSHYRNGKPVKGYTRRNGDRLDSPKDVKLNMVNGRLMTSQELADQQYAFHLALEEKLKMTRGWKK